jgi:hypothetical protein
MTATCLVPARFEGTRLRFGLVLFAKANAIATRVKLMWIALTCLKPHGDSIKGRSDSILRPVAARGVTQMHASMINPELQVFLR